MIRTPQNHADQTHDGIKGPELHKAIQQTTTTTTTKPFPTKWGRLYES